MQYAESQRKGKDKVLSRGHECATIGSRTILEFVVADLGMRFWIPFTTFGSALGLMNVCFRASSSAGGNDAVLRVVWHSSSEDSSA